MSFSTCNVDIDLLDEEMENDLEELDYLNYDDWISEYYSEWADFYQQVSDEEDARRHDRMLRNYEFQARGGFLPGDTVMVEVEPGYWSRSTVLLAGTSTLVVSVEQSTTVQVVAQLNAWWLD
ncbi:hypothetical protein ACQ4M3_24630 [Leptolyngbya sp. AN03gr2]|uniref:hypothetical protein n=1 Tax=unclassified Leptolyngbya TaxID=2650499 RepID=UPI003D322CA0